MPAKEVLASPFPAAPRSSVEMESPSWWWSASVGTLILALALRLAWVAVVPVEPILDAEAFDAMAKNIVAGRGYAIEPGKPTAFWAVGNTAVLAATYKVFGYDYGFWPFVALQIIAGVATIQLTMELTRRWFGARAGLAAGVLMAAWPGQIEYVTLLHGELFFNLCVVVALYAESRDRWRPGVRAVFAGVALAAATYVRPLALLVPAALAWCRLIGPESGRRRPAAVLIEAAVVVAVMAALIAPWTIRNARVFGRPVLMSTNFGVNLWMGNNPDAYGGYMDAPRELAGMDETDFDELLGRRAKQYIRENPGVFLRMLGRKLLLTYESEDTGVTWNRAGLAKAFGPDSLAPLEAISTAYWRGVVALALIGVGAALARLGVLKWLGQPAVVLWLYFAMIHAVIVGGNRYHYPSVPMIAALAGLGAATVLEIAGAWRARARSRDVAPRELAHA